MTRLNPIQPHLQLGLDNHRQIKHQLYIVDLSMAHMTEEFEIS